LKALRGTVAKARYTIFMRRWHLARPLLLLGTLGSAQSDGTAQSSKPEFIYRVAVDVPSGDSGLRDVIFSQLTRNLREIRDVAIDNINYLYKIEVLAARAHSSSVPTSPVLTISILQHYDLTNVTVSSPSGTLTKLARPRMGGSPHLMRWKTCRIRETFRCLLSSEPEARLSRHAGKCREIVAHLDSGLIESDRQLRASRIKLWQMLTEPHKQAKP
jgi:hypothetical protein